MNMVEIAIFAQINPAIASFITSTMRSRIVFKQKPSCAERKFFAFSNSFCLFIETTALESSATEAPAGCVINPLGV